ncbi:NMD3-related protein [Geoglobus acetivorans]|uniref:Nmd3 N-terminal domain-containing protein n=1 Tax=Geoglobus acetivorans TaxID=565033 RepID=A0ABZ3H3B3_GEOAI|nr:hypothetical protein [Geoglobus acetivorans]
MKCAVCGKESEHPVCGKCLLERIEAVKIPPVVEITVCPKCDAKRLEKWKTISLEEAVEKVLEKETRIHEEVEVLDFSFQPFGLDETGKYQFTFYGKIRDHEFEYSSFFEVRLKKIACEKCSRQAGGYYEAIIQIRADNRELKDEELERIGEIIGAGMDKQRSHPKAFITKIEEKKEGIDIYMGDKKLAQKIARAILKELGGELSESSKIAGRQDGRDIYRFTYSVRLPEYFEGDIVEDDGRTAIVASVQKRKGVDIFTGRTINLKNPKVLVRKEDIMESYVVSADSSALEVLDPETYRYVCVRKPEFEFNAGDSVFVGKGEDQVFVIHKSLVKP